MRHLTVLLPLVVACSGSHNSEKNAPSPPPPKVGSEAPPFAQPPDGSATNTTEQPPPPPPPPPKDDVPPPVPPPAGALRYVSDCSLSNPIARSPCEGAPASTRGLATCDSLAIKRGQSCNANAPSCYVETTCDDGHKAASEFLICLDQAPGRCRTRSAKQFKHDVHYLTAAELDSVVRQVQTLPLATFRYNDQTGGDPRLGFLIEDAPTAPFVDGRHVDLYALLSASVAAIQAQDKRIRVLEQRLEQCEPRPAAKAR